MRDIYLKRNELNELSQKLRVAKFDNNIKDDQVTKLIKEQDKIYQKYKFYDNYLKIGGKVKNEVLHTKER
jgi:hypothetical protein